mgnify:FL=1|jgi:hypothetical protein
MTQALLIVHRGSDGLVTPMPFTYKDGNLAPIVEEVADYLAGMGLVDSLWEGIAADRLRSVLLLQQDKREMADVIRRQQDIIEYAKNKLGPLMEAVV